MLRYEIYLYTTPSAFGGLPLPALAGGVNPHPPKTP